MLADLKMLHIWLKPAIVAKEANLFGTGGTRTESQAITVNSNAELWQSNAQAHLKAMSAMFMATLKAQ